jgi:L1 cell adhesion molecule like protein
MKIDEVILVGGSTRIPKVKDIVKNYFPNSRINDTINPDEAIAYGATIAAEKNAS